MPILLDARNFFQSAKQTTVFFLWGNASVLLCSLIASKPPVRAQPSSSVSVMASRLPPPNMPCRRNMTEGRVRHRDAEKQGSECVVFVQVVNLCGRTQQEAGPPPPKPSSGRPKPVFGPNRGLFEARPVERCMFETRPVPAAGTGTEAGGRETAQVSPPGPRGCPKHRTSTAEKRRFLCSRVAPRGEFGQQGLAVGESAL